MQTKLISLQETLDIAARAKQHARTLVLKGSTQLENNKLLYTNREMREALFVGVKQVRDACSKTFDNAKRILEKDEVVNYYENEIAFSCKYSLGNCFELALQALDHVLRKERVDMFAELYLLQGGDHGFLVLNRKPESDPELPETWGDAAVICDPWSNEVYPAIQYRLKLKDFYRDIDGENLVEDFDPDKHTLKPYGDMNTQYLHRYRNVGRIKTNFIEEMRYFILVLEEYRDKLDVEKERILRKYDIFHQRVNVLENKIDQIEQLILEIQSQVSGINLPTEYRLARKILTEKYNQLYKKITHAVSFQQKESSLFAHQGKDLKTTCMRFFGMPSTAASNITTILNDTADQLQKPLRACP